MYTVLFIIPAQWAFLLFCASKFVHASPQACVAWNSPTAALILNLLIARNSLALLGRGYLINTLDCRQPVQAVYLAWCLSSNCFLASLLQLRHYIVSEIIPTCYRHAIAIFRGTIKVIVKNRSRHNNLAIIPLHVAIICRNTSEWSDWLCNVLISWCICWTNNA
jgi:hypothetical protein